MQADLLQNLLERNNIPFQRVYLKSEVEGSSVTIPKSYQADSVLLTSEGNLVLAVFPANHRFDLNKLSSALHKPLRPLRGEENQLVTQRIANGKLPVLNGEPGLHVFIDESLNNHDEIYIPGHDNDQAYLVETDHLHKLESYKLIGASFSQGQGTEQTIAEQQVMPLKERVKAIYELPAMPETAAQILEMRALPEVNVEHVVSVIDKDPILVAQIISYANSAFFGQAGSVKTLKDAIFRVLGVDAVMNMALALVIGKSLKIPQAGPLGAQHLWQSSVYAAALMQRISMLMPWGRRPNPGTAYLVGLLHDVGLLVLGHLFPKEFTQLNQHIGENPNDNLLHVEDKLLGVTHTEIGKMAMRMWQMPEELVVVSTYHHNKAYDGVHKDYVQLLVLVERLLQPHGLALGSNDELSQEILDALGLDEEEVILAADEVINEGSTIKALAQQMCA